ncbi:MAG: PSD1 and planctomycete cytochrome C domain-containing protein [Bryobacterales bacterium]
MQSRLFRLAGLACLGLAVASAATDPSAAIGILERRCAACHGEGGMSGLDVSTRQALLAGGKRGAAIEPGKPDASLLIQAVDGKHELKMPMGRDALSPEEVETLRTWVQQGASWPEPGAGNAQWWSFQPPVKATLPDATKNPVDAFVDQTLSDKGLKPLPRADKRTLIRRAYFDLHGLPPSPEAVEAFVHDDSPDAWPKLIDELLASPRYGERWGRHWLDVVRYADTGGFETDIYFPNAWRYRDYVIESFNDDKPYDRFVREQIAGDELWPDDLEARGSYDIPKEKLEHLEARIGTGLYTIGPIYHEAALDGRQLRYEWLTDVVDTTGFAFLGLSVGCARCHDHKFDPLTQRDYHRLMAVFAGSEPHEEPVAHQMNQLGFYSGYPKLLRVAELKAAVRRIDAGARKRLVESIEARFSPEEVAASHKPTDKRSPQEQMLAAPLEAALTEAGLKENATGKEVDLSYTPDEREERDGLIRELGVAALGANFEKATATVLGRAAVDYPVHMTSRGDFRSTGDIVRPGFPKALTGGVEKPATPEDDSEHVILGRRKALAEWLTAPDHPLLARAMVNRIWQGHFGRGLVATPNDFGKQGDPPTHPELLDWLAVDFRENGWTVKRLHRLIMTSQAYQRQSGPDEANAAIDANNRYLWRMNRRRMEAEAMRDSVLAVAGDLNLKMGGRPVIPPLSADEMQGMWSLDQWPVALDEREHGRRSVYLYVKRSFPMPMLTTFDEPDSAQSCARRDVTTVAPQALAMLNSAFMTEQSKKLGDRLRESGDGPDAWIREAWRLALARAPDATETAVAERLFAGRANPADALPELALLVFNLNEFLYVD